MLVLNSIDQMLPVLDRLSSTPGVLRASLAGDHLRALAAPQVGQSDLTDSLVAAGITSAQVKPTQPVMEDIFMALIAK